MLKIKCVKSMAMLMTHHGLSFSLRFCLPLSSPDITPFIRQESSFPITEVGLVQPVDADSPVLV